MSISEVKLKLSYITGLKSVVFDELKKFGFEILDENDDSFFVEFSEKKLQEVKKMRSVSRAYLVLQDNKYHPAYISKNKSILGKLASVILRYDIFKTFKLSCAGSNSREAQSITKYIRDMFSLREQEDADLKVHIIKLKHTWEIGIQITPRPLSVRGYKVVNMSGGMDPTIAYAANSLAKLESANSYLNIFSGSATLLIEAGKSYPKLERLLGFDNNKKHLSFSIKNIKKAGLINQIQVKEADILNAPDFGIFDAIVSDLPFGMSISKNEDLEKLYTTFIRYCEQKLNPKGRLVIYTSEFDIIESILRISQFKIIKSLQLKFITNVDAYLRPKIVVCEFKRG